MENQSRGWLSVTYLCFHATLLNECCSTVITILPRPSKNTFTLIIVDEKIDVAHEPNLLGGATYTFFEEMAIVTVEDTCRKIHFFNPCLTLF